MADGLDHLRFQPISRPVRDRKKGGGFPPRIVHYRSPKAHATHLLAMADRAIEELKQERLPEGIAPKQIIEIQAHRRIAETKLAASGLVVLDSSSTDRVVAVSRDEAMSTVRERLGRYATAEDLPPRSPDDGPDEGKASPHEDVFDGIDGFVRRSPSERVSERVQGLLAETDDPVNIIVDLFAPEDDELREAWIEEVELLADRAETTFETYDDPAIGVSLVRLYADRALVAQLALLDQVAVIDTPAAPTLTGPGLASLQDLEELSLEVRPPDQNKPAVGIIDSGVAGGHPLLDGAILGADALHPAFGEQGEDAFGHGTLVAGLALYGSVLARVAEGKFEAPFPLASVRIFDEDGKIPAGVNPAVLLREAIEHLAEQYDCRVVCLSLGDHNAPFLGGKASPLAALVDDLARALDIVIVVPTGNVQHESLIAPAQLLAQWPRYLTEPGNELLSPSQAAIAITVGAIAERDATDLGGASVAVAATAFGPAPYARRGPGVRGAQKPDVVADGGNWVFDREDGAILDDTGTAVVSTSARDDLLFDTAIGSSFAAAQVANTAGRIAERYPDLSAAAIRALLLQGATPLAADHGFSTDDRLALAGHGVPRVDNCVRSTESRAVMLAENSLRPDTFHVYRFPAGTDFFTLGGERRLTTALSFDPPVRYRRYDYLAYQMELVVVRGISEDEVFHLASDANKGKLSELSAKQLPMAPSFSKNARGVNQVARVTYKRRPRARFRDDWFIVVRSVNKWMRDRSPQPYALAVAVEVEQSNQIRTQLRAEVELRARGRTRV